ncbi:MAG: glutamyl-tRNA reductase [Candidatus Omnitrophica bacterium]|nr:glutamyl-tRNA reductase [Candidatus Omnitrophota bacterium]
MEKEVDFFIAVGINHKSSPVEVREKFFLNPLEQELLLSCLKNEPLVREVFIFSTCNRTEIYAHLTRNDSALLIESLFSLKNIPFSQELFKYFYVKQGQEMIKHLFNVTCGLDSLVVGERQILGQVKDAVALASRKKTLDTQFNILTNMVIRAAKMGQTQTQISSGGSSISWAAVAMAQKLLGSLEGKSVLIIGAGKMSQLAAGDFQRKGVSKLFVMNRTREKGEELAQKFNGQSVGFEDVKEVLREVDVCICAAGASHYLIEKGLVERVMTQRQHQLLMLDISMPRNIHPDVASVEGVLLININELDKVVDQNIEQRRQAIFEVERIIAQKMNEFSKKIVKISRSQALQNHMNSRDEMFCEVTS